MMTFNYKYVSNYGLKNNLRFMMNLYEMFSLDHYVIRNGEEMSSRVVSGGLSSCDVNGTGDS